MSGWHYWLFEGEEGSLPLPIPDSKPTIFTSIEDARRAAAGLGRAVDIYRSPDLGGIFEFVETIRPASQVIRPQSIQSEEAVGIPTIHQVAVDDKLEISEHVEVVIRRDPAEAKALEARLSNENVIVRSIRWTRTSEQGSHYVVEALDEEGGVLESGVADDLQDAYLELWEHMKPPS